MFGGGGSSQIIPVQTPPEAPAAPAPPPIFGADAKRGAKARGTAAGNQGYSSTILGSAMSPNTAQKTLLGQ